MKTFIRLLLVLALAFVVINGLLIYLKSMLPELTEEDTQDEDRTEEIVLEEEEVEEEVIACEDFFEELETGDRQHQRSWDTYFSQVENCVNYQTMIRESQQAKAAKDAIRNIDNANYWGSVYAHLIRQADTSLNFLADSLYQITKAQGLDRTERAAFTVSFVQDIPYTYIFNFDCEQYPNKGLYPCVGYASFGILTPYEFIHTLAGDCDTRSVLLFILLRRMGFDPMIVVSSEYAHAMLAINLPAQGDYLEYAGKKYYFWETTATGWPVGVLPPKTNNVDYWKIALVDES